MAHAVLTESAVLTEASPLSSSGTEAEDKGIWRTRIIEADVEGSSGFYPADVLKRDGARAFPAGTHVYLDHPTSDEDSNRPERSVKDLAGYLMDGARFEETDDAGRGLFARIQFIDELKDRIKSLAPVIGLSIRAAGEVEESGDRRIVRSIVEGLSVDVVTRAGAGGRLVTMTESTKPDSPAEQGAPGGGDGNIPSTSGTGALLNEVASMRETLSDRVEQLSVDVARMSHMLKESQKVSERRSTEAKEIAEALEFLKDRQQKADQALNETKNVGQVVATLIEGKLPLPSMIRIAQGYVPGQDLHESIQRERDYLKKVIRESERGGLDRSEPSGLGLIESVMTPDLSPASNEDFSEMDAVLSGKMY